MSRARSRPACMAGNWRFSSGSSERPTGSDAAPEARAELRLLATAVLRQGDAPQIQEMIDRVGDSGRLPTWARLAVLSGFEPLTDPAFRRSIGDAHLTQATALAGLVSSSDPDVKRSAESLSSRLGKIEDVARARASENHPLTPDEQKLYEEGKVTYQICAACHQANGGGLANLAPSLVDSYWVSANPEVLVRIILNGKEGTPGFPGSMPAIGNSFNDQQIAGVLTYIRNSWGLHFGAVSLATVAKSRKENGSRVSDWTDVLLRSLEFDLSGGWKKPLKP